MSNPKGHTQMKDLKDNIKKMRALACATRDPAKLRALADDISDNYFITQLSALTEAQFRNAADDLEAGIVRVRMTEEMVAERLIKEFGYEEPAAMAGAGALMLAKDAADKAFDMWWYKNAIDDTVAEGTSVRELVEKYGYNVATAIAVFDTHLFEPFTSIPYAFAVEDIFVKAAENGEP